MKILLDNNIPVSLRHEFPGHEVVTAVHLGWEALANGRLLSAAEGEGFGLLVTLDQGFLHQHNMSGRLISVAILLPEKQSRAAFLAVIGGLVRRLDSLSPGTVTTIS